MWLSCLIDSHLYKSVLDSSTCQSVGPMVHLPSTFMSNWTPMFCFRSFSNIIRYLMLFLQYTGEVQPQTMSYLARWPRPFTFHQDLFGWIGWMVFPVCHFIVVALVLKPGQNLWACRKKTRVKSYCLCLPRVIPWDERHKSNVWREGSDEEHRSSEVTKSSSRSHSSISLLLLPPSTPAS